MSSYSKRAAGRLSTTTSCVWKRNNYLKIIHCAPFSNDDSWSFLNKIWHILYFILNSILKTEIVQLWNLINKSKKKCKEIFWPSLVENRIVFVGVKGAVLRIKRGRTSPAMTGEREHSTGKRPADWFVFFAFRQFDINNYFSRYGNFLSHRFFLVGMLWFFSLQIHPS